jgi:hypothetical protein
MVFKIKPYFGFNINEKKRGLLHCVDCEPAVAGTPLPTLSLCCRTVFQFMLRTGTPLTPSC